MARYLRHEGCKKCGSRDNFARYDDGSGFCFGCHYYEGRNAEKFTPSSERLWGTGDDDDADGGALSRAISQVGSLEVGQGLSTVLRRSCLDIPELLSAGAKSKGHDTLCFIYHTVEGVPCCVQSRNYSSDRKTGPKYFNVGSTEYAFPLYHRHPDSHTVVITEDTLSALKVARVENSFSALGTNIQKNKLISLQRKGFTKVLVWLDKDKWREGREICEKAMWIGMSARAIITDDDPKYYDEETIKRYLK